MPIACDFSNRAFTRIEKRASASHTKKSSLRLTIGAKSRRKMLFLTKLKRGVSLTSSNSLTSLTPFLEQGIIRVEGEAQEFQITVRCPLPGSAPEKSWAYSSHNRARAQAQPPYGSAGHHSRGATELLVTFRALCYAEDRASVNRLF